MALGAVEGKKLSKPAVIAVAVGGAAVAGFIIYKKVHTSSSAASTTTNEIDPVTGLPYTEDNEVDPTTGLTYLAEAQQYGSVSAAEASVAANGGATGADESGVGYGGYPDESGVNDSTVVSGTQYATNAAWSQAVESGLTNLGYTSTDVAAALGLYLTNQALSSAQTSIIQAAVAEYGTPPTGTFSIMTTPAQTVAVPNVAGEQAGAAHNAIVAAGLVPTAAAGQTASQVVTSTDPAAGTQVQSGSNVEILANSVVPDVVGETMGSAHNTLSAAGYKANDPTARAKGEPSKKCVSQSPAAGTALAAGGTVTINA